MILEEDTLYYRHDHPNGFMFSAGNEAPSEDDGWVEASDQIPETTPPSYECTTLEAFSELLRTERDAAVQLAEGLRLATQRLAAATSLVAALQNENVRLTEENAALRAEQGA